MPCPSASARAKCRGVAKCRQSLKIAPRAASDPGWRAARHQAANAWHGGGLIDAIVAAAAAYCANIGAWLVAGRHLSYIIYAPRRRRWRPLVRKCRLLARHCAAMKNHRKYRVCVFSARKRGWRAEGSTRRSERVSHLAKKKCSICETLRWPTAGGDERQAEDVRIKRLLASRHKTGRVACSRPER